MFLDFRENYTFPVLEPRKKAIKRTSTKILGLYGKLIFDIQNMRFAGVVSSSSLCYWFSLSFPIMNGDIYSC